MTAIVAGSYDPVTVGHIDIIERALAIFEKVIVLVAVNPDKEYMFSSACRAEAIRACFDAGVHVEEFDGMIADFVSELGDKAVIVRGIRNEKDTLYESELCNGYREMGITDMVLFPSSNGMKDISSSAVRKLLADGKSTDMIPEKAMEVLKNEL